MPDVVLDQVAQMLGNGLLPHHGVLALPRSDRGTNPKEQSNPVGRGLKNGPL